MASTLKISTPKWCLPLLKPCRYKGASGGRGSGKSFFFAEHLIEEHILDPNLQSVCIREIQKSLKFSAKKLLEDKIISMGLSSYFDVTQTEIRSTHGRGIIIFQGMQDHTADSIKSLEGFGRAWVEEAQSLSARSMELLLPTIRAKCSEIWFSWNPENEDDPIEELFRDGAGDPSFCHVHVNYTENPFIPDELVNEAERHRRMKPETFDHIWLGGYSVIGDAQIFADCFRVTPFQVTKEFKDPLHGLDFGFANDPTAAIRCYIHNRKLYISDEVGQTKLELDDTAPLIKQGIAGIEKYVIRADCARPESISYLKRHGLPMIMECEKWSGSVEDGIEFIKSFDEIIIHPRCIEVAKEFRKYSYKVDKRTGDVLPIPVDAYNHYIDALRYALTPIMKRPVSMFNVL